MDKAIARLQKRIDNYNRMLADEKIEEEEYSRYIHEARDEKRKLEVSRNKLVAEAEEEEEQVVALDMDIVKEKLTSYLELKEETIKVEFFVGENNREKMVAICILY